MSKDQYTVHDMSLWPAGDIAIEIIGETNRQRINQHNNPTTLSAREYVDILVKEFPDKVRSVEYWVNVKADK